MTLVKKKAALKQPHPIKNTISTVADGDAGIYINPLTDFGFKRIFGEEANKDLLIDFLNEVLKIEGGIKELQYTSPERQGRKKTDPKVVFDLYCITGKDERIIIEMQKLSQEFYRDRVIYYSTFPIQEQGDKKKEVELPVTARLFSQHC